MNIRRVFLIRSMSAQRLAGLNLANSSNRVFAEAFGEDLSECYGLDGTNSWIICHADVRARCMSEAISKAIKAPVDRNTQCDFGEHTLPELMAWLEPFIRAHENIVLVSDLRLADIPDGEISERDLKDAKGAEYRLKVCQIEPCDVMEKDRSTRLSCVLSKMHPRQPELV